MDYREEQFLRMQQSDTPKVPFYMSYPMQNLYLTEMEYEKDMDRMKELYPRDVSRIMDVIEDECDKMEYEGSLDVRRISGPAYVRAGDRTHLSDREKWNRYRDGRGILGRKQSTAATTGQTGEHPAATGQTRNDAATTATAG